LRVLRLKNLFRRRETIAEDLKTVTEVAGDQIAPGAGTLLLVLAGAAIGAAGAYYISQTRRIGIGGSFRASPLPHHRTSGSAYGGSRS
jgi:hypothetical protein